MAEEIGRPVRFSIQAHWPFGFASRNQYSPVRSSTRSTAANRNPSRRTNEYASRRHLIRQFVTSVGKIGVTTPPPIDGSLGLDLRIDGCGKYATSDDGGAHVIGFHDLPLESYRGDAQ